MLPHLNVSPRPIVQGALWSYSSESGGQLRRSRIPLCVVGGFLPECRVHWRCGMLWCECALLIAVSILSRCATRNSERLMLRTVSIVLSDSRLSLCPILIKFVFYYFKIKFSLTVTPLSLIPDSPYRTCELCSTGKGVFPGH